MSDSFYTFEGLSTRQGFNDALQHFQSISGIIDEFESHTNLADIVNDMLADKSMKQNQVLPAVYALLNDKFSYACTSVNIQKNIENSDSLYETVRTWNAVDVVLLYHHPDLGPVILNPKNKKQLDSIHLFKSNELVTIYTGSFSEPGSDTVRRKALDSLFKYFNGKKLTTPELLKKGKFSTKKKKAKQKSTGGKKAPRTRTTVQKASEGSPKQQVENLPQKASSGAGRMTPYYSIPVTNELFHNGNVEAWKKIIQSYNAKHPDLEVYIYYDGERIHDIHSLFKWGKVKHGSTILFAVNGEHIQDVAKLQRYLRQGASPMFEAFLKFPVNKILNLF